VTVTGNADGIVTISNIQIVKACSAPLTGTLFSNPSQGIDGTIGLAFDLSSPIAYARSTDGYLISNNNFFEGNVVTLAQGETHTFTFKVLLSGYDYCSFTFQMAVATPTGPVTETINDNGEPFQLTSLTPGTLSGNYSAYGALYIGGVSAVADHLNRNGHWVEENPKTFGN
jgi:hypothetical protein